MSYLRKIRAVLHMFIAVLTPKCKRIVREASAQIDGARPSAIQRLYIGAHLAGCKVCDDYVNNVRVIGAAVRRLTGHLDAGTVAPPGDADGALPDEARRRIIEKLRDAL